MFKFVAILALCAVAVSATPSTRHRYQENALRILTKEQMRGGRIVGGSDADIANYPYQIALFFGQGHTCGGSILNTNTVISAAHCTHGRNHANFNILAGQSNINSRPLTAVSQVIEHPQYDDWTLEYDIVILKLATHLTYGVGIQPIPLPVIGHQVPHAGMCQLTGWGDQEWRGNQFPDILQRVDVPAMSNAHCQSIYVDEEILEQHLCAGEVGRDACQGDSGGPLVYNGVHVGVVSWGYYCALEYPTVYARVSEFLGFILANAN